MVCRMASRHTHSHAHGSEPGLHAHDNTPQGGSHAERAATWLSLACAVHCLLMPIAISVMPLLGASGITDFGPAAELTMTLLVVVSALGAVIWGYRRHHDLRFVLATALGLAAYLVGHAIGHESESSWLGISLAVLGGLTLAASSFLSARLTHTCAHPSCAS